MNSSSHLKKFFALAICAIISCVSETKETTTDVVFSDDISDSSQGGNEPKEPESCKEEEKRTCHVALGEHEGVLSCFVGVQTCVDGEWSDCSDGEDVKKIPNDDGKPLSLTSEKVCTDNPCDPRCSKWVEGGNVS